MPGRLRDQEQLWDNLWDNLCPARTCVVAPRMQPQAPRQWCSAQVIFPLGLFSPLRGSWSTGRICNISVTTAVPPVAFNTSQQQDTKAIIHRTTPGIQDSLHRNLGESTKCKGKGCISLDAGNALCLVPLYCLDCTNWICFIFYKLMQCSWLTVTLHVFAPGFVSWHWVDKLIQCCFGKKNIFPVFTWLPKQKNTQANSICVTFPSKRQPEKKQGWCARDFCPRHVGGDSSKKHGKLTPILENAT